MLNTKILTKLLTRVDLNIVNEKQLLYLNCSKL